MANGSVSKDGSSKDGASGEAWNKTCQILRRELGEATFGSWLGQASLREQDGDVCLVAATGVARDWIRRHAWRRIGELWAQNDPKGRSLALKSKMEFEGQASASPAPASAAAGILFSRTNFSIGPRSWFAVCFRAKTPSVRSK